MCGRYGYTGSIRDLVEDFPDLEVDDRPVNGYNLSPGRKLSIIVNEGLGPRLKAFLWGLRTQTIPKPLVNVRAEGVSTHRLFGPLFAEHRCVVPASFFYEWLDDSEPRQPYVARPEDEFAPRASDRRLALAGIQLDGSFAIITRKAVDDLAKVHGRMPIILTVEGAQRWLNPKVRDAQQLREAAAGFDPRKLRVFKVGTEVNDARADFRELAEPPMSERQRMRAARDLRH